MGNGGPHFRGEGRKAQGRALLSTISSPPCCFQAPQPAGLPKTPARSTHTHRTCLPVVYFISLFILDPCPPGVIPTGKCVCCLVVSDFVTPQTVVCQAPLSIEFCRQEHWSGLPFPSPGDLPDPGIKPGLQADSLPTEPPGEPSSSPLACTLLDRPFMTCISAGYSIYVS